MTTNETNVSQPPKKPPLADWPTIKILTPPKGRFSPKTDEWCLTYCSQTVNGRYNGKEPFCRSVCIRKVFPHEVKNLIAFKTHRNLGPDGKAMYPLPSEGQPTNIPRILGGKPVEDLDAPLQKSKSSPESIKHWDEGWYLWTTQSRLAIHEKTDSMMMDFERQGRVNKRYDERREVWQDYQDHLEKVSSQPEGEEAQQNGESSKWWGPIVPPRPLPEFRSHSLLVPLPPDIPPFWERITKLLAPSHKVLGIFHESITSGEQRQFAGRVWEKAWTNEPFILASRTFSQAYERWKDREVPPDEDDGKKGST